MTEYHEKKLATIKAASFFMQNDCQNRHSVCMQIVDCDYSTT